MTEEPEESQESEQEGGSANKAEITEHDRRMQDLIVDYPEQAIALFVAEEAQRIDQRAEITSLRQEMSKYKLSRPLRRLDVPLEVKWSNGEREGIMFVIESETHAWAFNIYRLAHYCLDLSELRDLKRVVPVVVFLDRGYAAPELRLEGDQATYLAFWYRAFVLPAWHYSVYRDSDNIVARVCLPLMSYEGSEEKVDAYAYAVSGIRKLEPDPERQRKWIENVDTYTGLDENEQELLEQRYPQEVTEMTGIIERARDETRQERAVSTLLRQIELKYGSEAKEAYRERVEGASVEQLDEWLDRFAVADRVQDIFTDD